MESGGALLIKLAQWASSRPDLFGEELTDRLKHLQDSTAPHAWGRTVEALDNSLGKGWRDHLVLERVPIGSGSIAQVYRGVLHEGQTQREVAVKVSKLWGR